MGKFTGVLLASDFDNTLVWTEDALRQGTAMPQVPERNREALRYFMANGGRFAISTGRALPAFRRFVDQVPMNAPGVVCNGAGLYDFQAGRYIYTALLDDVVRDRGMEILKAFPTVGCEVYHESDNVHAVQPNHWTKMHQHLTCAPYQVMPDLWSIPEPCAKLLFEEEMPVLTQVGEYLKERGWAEDYELIFSSDHLLELTARGAHKGGMVLRLAQLLGIDRAHIYCIGDHANDIPMLKVAAQAFAPANCIDAIRDMGVRILSPCQDGAVADVVEILDRRYGADGGETGKEEEKRCQP